MTPHDIRPLVMATISIFLMFTTVFADGTAREKGRSIAKEADRRDKGWQDMIADVTMLLTNRHGQTCSRALNIRALEQVSDGDKSLVMFNSPPDVKGTALLSYSHAMKEDEQWLYLPSLKRIKRISTANKSGPFLGSEFAYEDMGSQEIDKYTYTYVEDATFNGMACFVVDRFPAYGRSGYTRQRVWCDKDEYRLQKIDFFDRKDALLKTLTYSGYMRYMDRVWRPAAMAMINHQTGKKTVLTWKNYRFYNGLTEKDFVRNSLKRSR